jgi:hypothetical protein
MLKNQRHYMPMPRKNLTKTERSALQSPYALLNSGHSPAAQFNTILSIIPQGSEPL